MRSQTRLPPETIIPDRVVDGKPRYFQGAVVALVVETAVFVFALLSKGS